MSSPGLFVWASDLQVRHRALLHLQQKILRENVPSWTGETVGSI